ncbi:hypothetical protein [Kribbella swartbergensis]
MEAYLTFPDGRQAAFEVTTLADPSDMQLDSLLARDNYSWALPGEWWWSFANGDVRDLPRLRACFERVVLTCERYWVMRPTDLPRLVRQGDADLEWLWREASVTMTGHPDVPVLDGEQVRHASITPRGGGGSVDEALIGLATELNEPFRTSPVRERFNKLLRHQADERHLFLAVHEQSLPFAVFYGLAFGSELPPDPLPVPDGISALWLAPAYSSRLLLWRSGEWCQVEPYDATQALGGPADVRQ